MLSQAQNSSVTALQELRGLVRGIRPPLLADRGLNEAVRSLCAGTSVPTTFTSTLTGRLPEPLETALYFAAAELVDERRQTRERPKYYREYHAG